MAPFRSTARSNRTGRGPSEQDVFAGLPVRKWQLSEGTFGLPPPEILQQDKDLVFPELPLPRDTNLLALHTQLLLREARKPRSAKRKAEPTVEVKPDEDEENREHQASRGWNGKKWSQVAPHLEDPDPEYLAKRRKGLASTYVEAPAFVPQIATRTAKVKKFDDAGQQIVYEVIVPEGQTIEGEVKDEDVSMLQTPALAPGTVIEGVGVANAEGQVVANDLLQPAASRRRKPPPPKRKGGPGRGKKKVMFQRPTTADGATAVGAGTPTSTAGTPTAFTSAGADANEDEDGEEGEEGEDGEEGDEDDREHGDLSDGEIAEPTSGNAASNDIAESTSSTLPADVAMTDAAPPTTATEATEISDAEAMPPPAIPAAAPATTTEPVEPLPTPAEPTNVTNPMVPPSALDSSLEALQESSTVPELPSLPGTSAEDVAGSTEAEPAAPGQEGESVVASVVQDPTDPTGVPSDDVVPAEESSTAATEAANTDVAVEKEAVEPVEDA